MNFLAPGGSEGIQVSFMSISDPGASRELALRPRGPEKLQMFLISLWLFTCSYGDKFDFWWVFE